MIIRINNEKDIEVNESDLVVLESKRLYNKTLKRNEGVDGDVVSFLIEKDGHNVICRGIVDGYTYKDKIKLRGKDKPYENTKEIRFEHASSVILKNGDDFLLLSELEGNDQDFIKEDEK